MGPGALRRRFFAGPRWRSAPECVCPFILLLETRNAWARGRFTLALRLRARSLARVPGFEDVVHAESLWHGSDRVRHFANMRSGSPPGGSNCKYAGARA